MTENTAHLLWVTIKNARSRGLNRELIGLKVEEEFPGVSSDELESFARATRDQRYLMRERSEPTPFFVARLSYPSIQKLMLMPGLGLNLLRMVHGQMEVHRHGPIFPDRPLRLRAEIRDIRDTPAGELLEISCRVSHEGQLAIEGIVGLLVRGRAPAGKRSEMPEEPREELFRVELQTEEGQQLEYARASGDRNFIHTNGLLARMAGLPRTIMHGMCVLAMTHNALVDCLAGGELQRIRSLRARFGRPVIPGDRLTVVGYASGTPEDVPFAVLTSSGKPAIKNGLFRLAVPPVSKG